MGALYMGLLPIAGLLVLAYRRLLFAPEIRFFTGALLVLLAYALGRYTPVFSFIHQFVPGVNLFRRPADASFLIGFCLAMLGGYGVHRILVDGWRWGRDGIAVFCTLMLAICGAADLAIAKDQLPKAAPALIVASASLALVAASLALMPLDRVHV